MRRARGGGVVLVRLLDRHSADAGHASGQHERAGECSPHVCMRAGVGVGGGRERDQRMRMHPRACIDDHDVPFMHKDLARIHPRKHMRPGAHSVPYQAPVWVIKASTRTVVSLSRKPSVRSPETTTFIASVQIKTS